MTIITNLFFLLLTGLREGWRSLETLAVERCKIGIVDLKLERAK
jgi:hypothetical protein